MPEPDIPYIYLEDLYINKVKDSIKMLPVERRKLYLERNISEININKLIANKQISDFLNNYLHENIDFKIASNILLGNISEYLNKNNKNIFDTKLSYNFINLVNKLKDESISSKIFKEIINDIMEKEIGIDKILEEKGISLMNDTTELETIINKVLIENINSVNDYKNGKENAFKYLMGMVMKATKGTANPKIVNDLIINLLSKDVN